MMNALFEQFNMVMDLFMFGVFWGESAGDLIQVKEIMEKENYH